MDSYERYVSPINAERDRNRNSGFGDIRDPFKDFLFIQVELAWPSLSGFTHYQLIQMNSRKRDITFPVKIGHIRRVTVKDLDLQKRCHAVSGLTSGARLQINSDRDLN